MEVRSSTIAGKVTTHKWEMADPSEAKASGTIFLMTKTKAGLVQELSVLEKLGYKITKTRCKRCQQ
jgi:hypothetical protein